jgi:hypothetical protein
MSIFKNKRVCIIGPAPHILEQDQRELIDGFDVVCRINDALPVPKEMQKTTGERCDVLYIWRKVKAHPSWQNLKEIRLKPDSIFEKDWLKGEHEPYREKIVVVHPDSFYRLQRIIRTRPNTGVVAINDILDGEPKELYITGITFYQEGAYYPGYVSAARNEQITKVKGDFARHRQGEQMRLFRKLYLDHPAVKCDSTLEEIMKKL